MKKIAIEEHFYTESYLNYLQSRKDPPRLESIEDEDNQKIWRLWSADDEYTIWLPKAVSKLSDLGEIRLKEMDESGIDMQVISFIPGIDAFDAADGTPLT